VAFLSLMVIQLLHQTRAMSAGDPALRLNNQILRFASHFGEQHHVTS
jgi:hypothetical protein